MFDGKFRAPVDAAVKPLGAALRKTRLTPDHLTVVGLVVAAAAAVAVGAGRLRLGLVLVILAALPDLLDGALAKASETSSQRGAFFDSTVDRITDALLLGGITYYFAETEDPRLTVLPFAVLAMSSVISYQRAKAESLGLRGQGRSDGARRAHHAVAVPVGSSNPGSTARCSSRSCGSCSSLTIDHRGLPLHEGLEAGGSRTESPRRRIDLRSRAPRVTCAWPGPSPPPGRVTRCANAVAAPQLSLDRAPFDESTARPDR